MPNWRDKVGEQTQLAEAAARLHNPRPPAPGAHFAGRISAVAVHQYAYFAARHEVHLRRGFALLIDHATFAKIYSFQQRENVTDAFVFEALEKRNLRLRSESYFCKQHLA